MSSFYSSHVQHFQTPDFYTDSSTIANYNTTINSKGKYEKRIPYWIEDVRSINFQFRKIRNSC